MKEVLKITERGWGGHFCCNHQCLFRRNTLIEYKDIKIVVSTVGNMVTDYNTFKIIKFSQRYYETMVFHAKKNDKYHDANVQKPIFPKGKWYINTKESDIDIQANIMHENIVKEISRNLYKGNKY